MKKIEAYIRAERLKETIQKLKEIGAPGFTYYDVRGHGREYKSGFTPTPFTPPIVEDILPRSKIEVFCEDGDVEKIVDAIRGGCCTAKPGDGMVFISTIDEAQRLKTKEKVQKLE
ncbi:P-II family nitrogen regulator [Candidatus Hecatella orcuttiae]|uniref:P-II family nitrogen regulator n=1 Tax=Candidatus Hecatella orcuttiae TaxID=1935119 RepID=UPI002867F66B|nr:P-II family nitrogen regulator [Candidatus Hecatella orcuttiae]